LAYEGSSERFGDEAAVHAVAENETVILSEEREGILNAFDGAREALSKELGLGLHPLAIAHVSNRRRDGHAARVA
jgi:hypothetical protein